MSKQEDESTPRVELTIHCPKCRNVIGKDTKLCTSCGAEVDKVPSVDRPALQQSPGATRTAP
ncbi:MAG: hypothetical protein KKI08_21075 [Armatimonadetes bacterium]|nr:hypothetical protein [Armatimonadota bacterium]